MKSIALVALAILALAGPVQAASCQVADILFGDVQLDILKKDDYETAIVRSGTFNNPKKNYDALLGEITVERGGFSVHDPNQIVVGSISPKLVVEGDDDVCDKRAKIVIKPVQPGVYVIMNGASPVGTIKGRFPKNTFGVK